MTETTRPCTALRSKGLHKGTCCHGIMVRTLVTIDGYPQALWVCDVPDCQHREPVYTRKDEV